MADAIESDAEFAQLADNAADAGLPWASRPEVRRVAAIVDDRVVSGIAWGAEPQAVLLHGGAQNAHTWDTVALALGRPLLALDLPGHGHSTHRRDADYAATTMASDVARAVEQLAPEASILIGIGLGASVGLLAAARLGPRVARLALLDSAPGLARAGEPRRASEAAATVAGFTAQHRFSTFDEMVERALRYAPTRVPRAVRRGVEHNSRPAADGGWCWRWDPALHGGMTFDADTTAQALDAFRGHVLLVRGERSDIVTDEAVAAFVARHPDTDPVTLVGAGHAVQGDDPRALAAVLQRLWSP